MSIAPPLAYLLELLGLFPRSTDPIPPVVVDRSIGVWDGALSAAECAELVALFDASPEQHIDGNLLSYGKSIVDYKYKKVSSSGRFTGATVASD